MPGMRLPLATLLLGGAIACDPGFSVMVTRPVAVPVGRDCAARAMQLDSTFTVMDTVAQPWRAREDSLSLGGFRWWISASAYPEHGELSRRAGVGADTLVAVTGRLGRLRPDELRRTDAELAQRLNTVAEQCSRPLAAARCSFRVSGRAPVPCNSIR
jgi:hypothetical protein